MRRTKPQYAVAAYMVYAATTEAKQMQKQHKQRANNAQATTREYYSNAQMQLLAAAHVQQHTYSNASNAQATARGVTKKQQVINMCSEANGTTVHAIANALSISKVAARSLIGDVRRSKIIVRCINNVYKI